MEFKGSSLFRYRIICSILAGTPIIISEIRSDSEYPGLADYEVKYLELIAKLMNGSIIDVNETGTRLRFTPGIITNNPTLDLIEHDCGTERGLGYFIEGILPFVMFGKNKLNINLIGVTNEMLDIGVDIIQYVQIPLIKKFGVEEIDIKILSRGNNGKVNLKATPIRKFNSDINLVDTGKIKRVRGVAYTSKINAQMGNRAAYAAKGHLHSFLPDIWINTDHHKSETALLGIVLVAETNTGALLSSEYMRGEESTIEDLETEVPEDLGTLAVYQLLDEIFYGGYVDTSNQCLVLLLMALSTSKSSLRLGRLSQSAVEVLRLIKKMFRVTFTLQDTENPGEDDIKEEEEGSEEEGDEEDYQEIELENPLVENLPRNVIATCVGIGYENMARIGF
ncbi:unnamed protein product [Blepharisma stoltei]|uniref:RNA 3'-terminal phosphate cyclase-like protein n=1 Tax=Blepharisma stoltei TaxID=1481888 RepID=A0AAU9JBF6_9CILI|nr:unnamed protein product [Blepharisma stoltei]